MVFCFFGLSMSVILTRDLKRFLRLLALLRKPQRQIGKHINKIDKRASSPPSRRGRRGDSVKGQVKRSRLLLYCVYCDYCVRCPVPHSLLTKGR